MKSKLLYGLLLLSFFSCKFFEKKNDKAIGDDKLKMMDADRAFSK